MATKFFGIIGTDNIRRSNRKTATNGFTERIEKIERAIGWEPLTPALIASKAGFDKVSVLTGHLRDEVETGRLVKTPGGYRWHYMLMLDGQLSPELQEGGPNKAELIFLSRFGLIALPQVRVKAEPKQQQPSKSNTPANVPNLAELQRQAKEAQAALDAALSAAASGAIAAMQQSSKASNTKPTGKKVSVGTAFLTLAERLLTEQYHARLLELLEETPQCAREVSSYTMDELRELDDETATLALEDMANELYVAEQVSAMLSECSKAAAV